MPKDNQTTRGIGHNSQNADEVKTVEAGRLKSFVNRIEKLNDDRDAVIVDIRDVYAEIKSAGFDVKVVRQLVRLRAIDATKRREQEELLELYSSAIGLE